MPRKKPLPEIPPGVDPKIDSLRICAALFKEQIQKSSFVPMMTQFQRRVESSPSRRLSLLTTRRTGKTIGMSLISAHRCSRTPDYKVLYIGQTGREAREQFWYPTIDALTHRHVPHKPERTDSIIRFDNGSQIWMAGCHDEGNVRRFRGYKFDLVILDEAAFFPSWISDLINSVLNNTLSDRRGQMIMTSTPGPFLEGYFYEATTGARKNWTCLKATVADNEKFDRWKQYPKSWTIDQMVAEYLREEREENGLSETDAAYRREYLGEWVVDPSEMIFDLSDPEYSTAADHQIRLVGVDIGYRDKSSVVAIGIQQDKITELETVSAGGLGFEELAGLIKQVCDRHRTDLCVLEPATGGKNLEVDLSVKYHLNVSMAEKHEKRIYLQMLRSDIKGKNFRFRPGSQLVPLMRRAFWSKDRRTEDPRCPFDEIDATLYAYRAAQQYVSKEPVVPEVSDHARRYSAPEWERDALQRDLDRDIGGHNIMWEDT